MRPLVAVRRATGFDPGFIERHELFEPVGAAYRRLGPLDDFPAVDALGGVFEGDRPVRFDLAGPRRRREGCVDVRSLYDARIVLEGVVPTRPRCWHDLMNALVWGTFPDAKRSLHTRQHRAIAERVPAGARGLPPRTPELDALALVDEGGVIVLAADPDRTARALSARSRGALASLLGSGEANLLVFGHAIYESLALGARPAVVAALVLGSQPGGGDALRAADGALARALSDVGRFRSPRELMRVDLAEARSLARQARAPGR
jgi:hypothetical protein